MGFTAKHAILATLVAALAITHASAKEEGTTRTMSLTQKHKVWELQSRSVAQELGLSAAEAARLTDAHADLMTSYSADAAKVRARAEGRMKTMLALMERNAARREALTSRALEFLSAPQATSATAVLGAFSEQWDDMVATLMGFRLGEGELRRALAHVNRFVEDCDAARLSGMASGDIGSIMLAMNEGRERLDKELADILTPKQLKTWGEMTPLPFAGRSVKGHLPMPKKPYALPKGHPLRVVAIEPDTLHTSMLRMRDTGWLGSDVGHSIVLSDDKTLWLFGDTFIGGLKDGKRVGGAPMINNTIAIEDRKSSPPDNMTFHWRTTPDGKPANFFPHQEGTPGAYYWPTAGIMAGGELFIYNWCVGGNAQGAGGWGGFGGAVIRISNPLDPPEKWVQKAHTLKSDEGHLFISNVYLEEPFVYLYGIMQHKATAVARIRTSDLLAGKLTEAYEYWVNGPDGPHWGKEPNDCVPQFAPPTTEGSIHYEKEWGLYTVYTYDGGPNIYLCTAPKLTGPWTEPAPIYWVPEHHNFSFGIISYAVRQHPQFSTKPGEVILSYATNVPGSITHHFTDEGKDLYVHRFLRLQMEPNKGPKARKR